MDDAVEILMRRYIGDDPEKLKEYKELEDIEMDEDCVDDRCR